MKCCNYIVHNTLCVHCTHIDCCGCGFSVNYISPCIQRTFDIESLRLCGIQKLAMHKAPAMPGHKSRAEMEEKNVTD